MRDVARISCAITALVLAVLPARAQTTTTTTTSAATAVVVRKTVTTSSIGNNTGNGISCTAVPPLADIVAPVTPSVDAGRQASGSRNYALARANFRPLAEKGDPEGEAALGHLLMQNCTGLQDKQEGLEWLAKAADGGDTDAALELGSIYMTGQDGVAIDDNKAFALISKAAAAGTMVAETDLGYMYLHGRGVPIDKYQGMTWSVKGGEQGSPAALSYFASAYFKGDGLPQNLDKAAFYGAVAFRRGDAAQRAAYKTMLDNISRQMSSADIKDAVTHSAKWTPGPGSLSDVTRDAAKWRAQNQASKN
jgi:TPR repeat protein